MSFAERIVGLMARPGADPVPKDDTPLWLKYAGRGVGTVAGFMSILLGLYNCVFIIVLSYWSLLGGIWQINAGFLVLVCEAPCCCMFIDFVQTLSDRMDARPYWNKAAIYIAIAIPPFIMSFGLSTLFGSGLIFATGLLYGMMAMGKKASAEEMRTSAANIESGFGSKNLVPNAAPIGQSVPPQFSAH